jgi:hypothetical protein
MFNFRQLFDYVCKAAIAIPFVAVVGDYLVRGVFHAGLGDGVEPPTFIDTALACQSLTVLYVLGRAAFDRQFRQSKVGKALVSTVVVLSAVRMHPSCPPGRSPFDALGYVGKFAATESANLSDREYAVADSLGWRGRPTMWAVSAHARTRNMYVLQTEKYNAMLHCTWQCHYTQYENVSVALAFGNAHEAGSTRSDGTTVSIGDTIADRINNEVARRYGSELAPDYMNFFGAVTTSIAKVLVDKIRDKGVRLANKIPLVNQLTLLSNLHNYLTLDGCVISAPCDDICERAFNHSELAKAKEGEDYLSSLRPEEVEENYIKPLLYLLSTHNIRPADLLPPSELLALTTQAGPTWPRNLTSSVTIEEID